VRIDDLVRGEVAQVEAGEKVGILRLGLEGADGRALRGGLAAGVDDEFFMVGRIEDRFRRRDDGGRDGRGDRSTQKIAGGEGGSEGTEGKNRARLDQLPTLQDRARNIHEGTGNKARRLFKIS
jgi:hypothetical protein